MILQIKSFLKIYSKVFSLLTTMLLGALLPQFHAFSFLIQYLLMAMLFFAFLDIKFKPQTFQKNVLWVLLANVVVAFICYAVLASFDVMLALTAFMTAIAPTAIAAPVIISFIQGEIEYVVAAVLITNLSSAVIIPLTLPFLLGANIQISFWEVLEPVLIVMFVPLILAQLVSHQPSRTQDFIRKGKVGDLCYQLRHRGLTGWSAPLAGSQSITWTKKSLFRHLDRTDVYQSTGCYGTYVLHFVSSFV